MIQAIGLTGGIGSGKSTVARILGHMGYAVYIADREASRLMNEAPYLRTALIHRFGPDIYLPEGPLNKQRLSALIFSQPELLAEVNRIVHPEVMRDFQNWKSRQSSSPVFFESAILFEAHLNGYFDAIICITASETTRLKRVMTRDRATTDQVKARMSNQLDEEEKCKQSDFILYNDDDHLVLPQLLTILNTQLSTQ